MHPHMFIIAQPSHKNSHTISTVFDGLLILYIETNICSMCGVVEVCVWCGGTVRLWGGGGGGYSW